MRHGLSLRFARHSGGNIAMLFALFLPVFVTVLAIVIDLGAVSLQRRNMQAMSDLAAIVASSDPENASALALEVLNDNGHTDVQVVEGGIDQDNIDLRRTSRVWLEVTPGQYVPDTDLAPADRFVARQAPYNAVKVVAAQPGQYFIMAGLIDPPVIETSGVAHASGEAAFSVGSRLVRVEGGVLNALLGSLIGSNLKLTAMDYNALLTADVSLLGTLDALAADLDLTAASYDEVLDTQISVAQLALAARESGTMEADLRSALQKIGTDAAAGAKKLKLGDAIDLGALGRHGPSDRDTLPDLPVKPMEMITAALTAANGEHQVTLDLGLSVPGLLKTTVDLKIGERPQSTPWLRLSGPDKIVSTVQTRLKITTEVPGLGLLLGTKVKLPLYVEVAAADARLAGVDCRSADLSRASVQVDAQPAIGRVMIGEVVPAKFAQLGNTMDVKPARIVSTKLIKIDARSDVGIGNLKATRLSFSYDDIEDGKVKTATTKDYSASLAASAMEDLDITIVAGPLGIGTPKLLRSAVVSTLTPALEPVDAVAYNVLTALGIHLGEADVRVHGLMCQRPVLVQ